LLALFQLIVFCLKNHETAIATEIGRVCFLHLDKTQLYFALCWLRAILGLIFIVQLWKVSLLKLAKSFRVLGTLHKMVLLLRLLSKVSICFPSGTKEGVLTILIELLRVFIEHAAWGTRRPFRSFLWPFDCHAELIVGESVTVMGALGDTLYLLLVKEVDHWFLGVGPNQCRYLIVLSFCIWITTYLISLGIRTPYSVPGSLELPV
jgi:hypothetical protein